MVFGWVGIVGRDDILRSGGVEEIDFSPGLAHSSKGVRGKALWGNFEAEKRLILLDISWIVSSVAYVRVLSFTL